MRKFPPVAHIHKHNFFIHTNPCANNDLIAPACYFHQYRNWCFHRSLCGFSRHHELHECRSTNLQLPHQDCLHFSKSSCHPWMRKSILGSIWANTDQRVSGPTMNILQPKRAHKSERNIHIPAGFIQCKKTIFWWWVGLQQQIQEQLNMATRHL